MEIELKRFIEGSLLGLFLSFLFAFPAHAEEKSSDKWNFQIAAYIWLAGQKGTVETLPGLPPGDIDVDSYDDIWGNINLAGMLVAEARKGRFGVVMDVLYTDIETEDPTPLGIFYSALNSRTKSWMLSVAGLYRLLERENRFLDVVGGARYWSVDSELTLKGPCSPPCRNEAYRTKKTGLIRSLA